MKKRFNLNATSVAVASELRRPGSNELLIGKNGELNASNKSDLIKAVATLLDMGQNLDIVDDVSVEKASASKTHREMVIAAFNDKEELAALGDHMRDTLNVAINRDGFMRRFLQYQELNQGEIPSVRMNMKNVTASMATGPVQTMAQFVRDNEYYPQEFYITARPYIEQKHIQRTAADILEEKYNDALEAIMVTEDRTWKQMADELIGIDNPHLNISGATSPQSLAELTSYVNDWGVTPAFWLIASDIWKDIVADESWHTIIDPVSQYELLQTGRLGTIHGMEIVSDHYRHAQHKVLERGEMYVVGSPDQHGQYSDRGGVESQPLDGTQEKVPGRGWFMSETMSAIIANSRSIARGRRV